MTAAVGSPPVTGRTTVLVWRPVADHWRVGAGGTAGAVLDAVLRAVEAPGLRLPIPAPARVEVEELARAGSVLNAVVRQRYLRGSAAGAMSAAAAEVAGAAQGLGAGRPVGGARAVLCVGKTDRLVLLRLDRRLHAVARGAATGHGLSLGGWVRDGVAAVVGEHQARRPAQETRDGRTVAGRVAGLLVQAGAVAADAAEAAAVDAANDALADAVARMAVWGSRR